MSSLNDAFIRSIQKKRLSILRKADFSKAMFIALNGSMIALKIRVLYLLRLILSMKSHNQDKTLTSVEQNSRSEK